MALCSLLSSSLSSVANISFSIFKALRILLALPVTTYSNFHLSLNSSTVFSISAAMLIPVCDPLKALKLIRADSAHKLTNIWQVIARKLCIRLSVQISTVNHILFAIESCSVIWPIGLSFTAGINFCVMAGRDSTLN